MESVFAVESGDGESYQSLSSGEEVNARFSPCLFLSTESCDRVVSVTLFETVNNSFIKLSKPIT